MVTLPLGLVNDRTIPTGAVRLYLLLASSESQGLTQAQLAQRVGLERSSVVIYLRALTAAGYVETVKRGRFGSASTYRLPYANQAEETRLAS